MHLAEAKMSWVHQACGLAVEQTALAAAAYLKLAQPSRRPGLFAEQLVRP
jgi:hypothetical protein